MSAPERPRVHEVEPDVVEDDPDVEPDRRVAMDVGDVTKNVVNGERVVDVGRPSPPTLPPTLIPEPDAAHRSSSIPSILPPSGSSDDVRPRVSGEGPHPQEEK